MSGKNDVMDPKGLIRESYRIDGITDAECRSIFMDWALSLPDGVEPRQAIAALLARHGTGHERHPMSAVLRQGLSKPVQAGRRGGRAGRGRPRN